MDAAIVMEDFHS